MSVFVAIFTTYPHASPGLFTVSILFAIIVLGLKETRRRNEYNHTNERGNPKRLDTVCSHTRA